ncbi:hypothetical protein N5D52_26390 [Pseudomonas sp. GD03860]|uniref:hypothetical protein n=1 Tax=Pseudomonas TaxID=286 RepID=UPI002363DB31|nr:MULTISPECIES: hypothetical protein [Pseudomonas]MDD2056514.1 hypothetical protein [Pseudomonas putida]MDH0640456.1 hypothetical protein [Pseudomonas sp. GD03860]
MAGIGAVTLNGNPLQSSTLAAGSRVTINADQPPAEVAPGKVVVDPSSLRNSKAQASDSSDPRTDSEPAHVKQLRKMIEKLQKQLEEQQKHLQQVMASRMEETAKAAAVAAAQSAIGATMAALGAATAALVKALTESGGASSGSLVSTSA